MKLRNAIITAAAIGLAAGIIKQLIDDAEREKEGMSEKEVEELLKKSAQNTLEHQIVVNEMTVTELKKLFDHYTEKNGADTYITVSYITPKIEKIFPGLELDREHYLALLIYDSYDREVIDKRLINFNTLSDNLKKLLDEHEGIFTIEK